MAARLRPPRHDGERQHMAPTRVPTLVLRAIVLLKLIAVSSAIGLVSNSSAHRSMISVEGVKGQHVHGEIDPDEYQWSKLPGRCCFALIEECAPGQKKSDCKRNPPDSCRECNVWSTPENYCHGSHENCESCGMKLYCPAPPPLLDGNKVCTGTSRIGYGCNDEYGTGMCAQSTESDCEEACRTNEDCELFVYYPEEKKGTCVLCSDLISFERTLEEATRAYAVGASHNPPAPPGASSPAHFAVMPNPAPPLPPRPPSPAAPAPKASHLGRHKSDKSHAHVDCTFLDNIEFSTQRQTGYTDRVAVSKEECCQMCGHLDTGCANFVFEPSSGQCALLPLTPLNELERDDNDGVVSGIASVGVVAVGAAAYSPDNCAFIPGSGYSSGSMGLAPRLPGGEMQTREECCQVCGVTKGCARFTFSPGDKSCIMYAETAELVMVHDLTSGSIPSKLTGASIAGDGTQGGEEVHALVPPAPSFPAFAMLENLSPPPPPDMSTHGDSTVLQDLISDLSVVVFTIISLGFLMCVYCFFAPQLLTSLHRATNGKMGKVHVKAHRHLRVPDDDDEAWLRMPANTSTALMAVDEPPTRKKKRNGRKDKDKGSSRRALGFRESRCAADDGRGSIVSSSRTGNKARLVVQTPEITQTRDVDVSRCDSADALRTLFYNEFPSVLKAVSLVHTQLFCLAPAPPPKGAPTPSGEKASDDPFAWLLVTEYSSFARVLECPAFRLQDKRCDEALTAQYVVAFPSSEEPAPTQNGDAKSGRRATKCHPPDAASAATCAPPRQCEPMPKTEPTAEKLRGRSRDRRSSSRGYASAPPSCVGFPGAENDGSGSDEGATSGRHSTFRGTGTTPALAPPPDLARLAASHAAPPPPSQLQEQLHAQALAAGLALTSSSLQQHHVSCQLPGCNALPPARAASVAGSACTPSAWGMDHDEDPDGTGVSRSDRARAMAELE